MDGFGHNRNHFGIVFLSQPNDGGKTVLYCTKQLTKMRYYCNFWSNGWILTWQGSFLGSFFRAVQWWWPDGGIQNRTANPESNDTVILNLRMCHFSWFIQIYRGFVLIIRQPLKTQKCPLQVEFYPSLVFKCHLKETKPYQTKPNQLQPYTNIPNVFLNPFTLEM